MRRTIAPREPQPFAAPSQGGSNPWARTGVWLALAGCSLYLGCSSCDQTESAPPTSDVEVEVEEVEVVERMPTPAPPVRPPAPAAGMPESNANVEVEELGDNAARFKGEQDGQAFSGQVGGDIEVSEIFASDVPVYGGSVPLATMAVMGDKLVRFEVSGGRADRIAEFYREELAANGWTILEGSEYVPRGNTQIRATKDRRRLTATASESGGDAFFSLSVNTQ